MSHLYPFFVWCNNSSLGTYVRDSSYAVPIIEVFHLVGLAMLLGTISVVNFGLVGIGMRRQPVSEVARGLAPWTRTGLIIMVLSGVPLFMNEALRCYDSLSFRIKMTLLATAIIFHFTLYRKVTMPEAAQVKPLWGKLAGWLSLCLWFGIGLAGRGIGFLG